MREFAVKIWEGFEKAVYLVIKPFFVLFKKDLTDEIFQSFMQFVKFGIVGLSNTAVSYILYVISLLFFQKLGIFPKIDYIISSMIGFILSVLWSFYWNNKMVFTLEDGQERSLWKALIKTYISYSFTGLFLSNILLIFWVQFCNIPELIAPLINLIISVPLNFIINKFWAFKKESNFRNIT